MEIDLKTIIIIILAVSGANTTLVYFIHRTLSGRIKGVEAVAVHDKICEAHRETAKVGTTEAIKNLTGDVKEIKEVVISNAKRFQEGEVTMVKITTILDQHLKQHKESA